jgi:hypothetical protein
MAGRIVPEGGWQSRLKPMKTPRVEKPNHLAFIRKLVCVCCATGDMRVGFLSSEIQAAHIQGGSLPHGKEPAGGAQKSDDRWALPLCGEHHTEQHAMNEGAFWRRYQIDQFLLALVLWGLTGDTYRATEVIGVHAATQPLWPGESPGSHRRSP